MHDYLLCNLVNDQEDKKMTAKKRKNNGSITLLDDGTYQVRLKYEDCFGKEIDRKRKAYSKTEADRVLRMLKKEAEKAKEKANEDVSSFSVEMYFKRLFLPYKSNLKSQSYRRLESTIDTHIVPNHGMKIWTQLTSEDISSLLRKMYNEGLSHSSIKKVHDAYSGMFHFAVNVRRDIDAADNPMNAVNMISENKFEHSEVRWFTPDEITRFASEAERRFRNGNVVYKYGLVYLFLMNTGLREGEVCALNKSDIDFDNKLIRITKGVNTTATKRPDGTNAYSLEVATPKTRNSIRYVPMNEEAERFARSVMEQFPSGNRFIYSDRNSIVRPDTLYKQFNSILLHAGMKSCCGLHTLRHTFVSALFENDVDIYTISEIIGDTVETVTKTYLHLYKARKAKAVQFVNVIQSSREYIA